jgi:hypothetical protein
LCGKVITYLSNYHFSWVLGSDEGGLYFALNFTPQCRIVWSGLKNARILATKIPA